jgi:hypothetical protein
MNLLRLEFDVQHIAVLSRKVQEEHALIRLILSTLATPEEIENVTKKDLRIVGKEGSRFYSIRFTGRKTRISPLDEKTYSIVREICKNKGSKQRIFNYSRDEMDRIVEKYSPKDRKYNTRKLREAVTEILKDCMLFMDEDYVKDLREGANLDRVADFLQDFHPMYSGMWDMDDDEVAKDFVLTYSAMTGISDAEKLADVIGEGTERIERFLGNRIRKI